RDGGLLAISQADTLCELRLAPVWPHAARRYERVSLRLLSSGGDWRVIVAALPPWACTRFPIVAHHLRRKVLEPWRNYRHHRHPRGRRLRLRKLRYAALRRAVPVHWLCGHGNVHLANVTSPKCP